MQLLLPLPQPCAVGLLRQHCAGGSRSALTAAIDASIGYVTITKPAAVAAASHDDHTLGPAAPAAPAAPRKCAYPYLQSVNVDSRV